MSIKTSKRIALGVIASLVFAPFAAVAPASAAEMASTAMTITEPKVGRVGSPITTTFTTTHLIGAANNDTLTFRAVMDSRPTGSSATINLSGTGSNLINNADPTVATTRTVTAANASGNELLPVKLVHSPASGTKIAAATAGVAGSVGFTPDVVGTYRVTVWNDVNLDGIANLGEIKMSADIVVAGVPTTATVKTYNAAAATGGTAPYTFLWNNGAISETATGLVAGVYTANITDAASCSGVASVTITEPTALVVTANASATANVSCFGGNNGAAAVAVSGGTGAYTYLWSNGATTEDLTGVVAGTYTVTVTDRKSVV
jgi:hypothetical protein